MNNNNNRDPFEEKIFFGKYKPEKKIGEGSFGKIYSSINITTNEKFALKLENKTSGQNLLESEAYVLCYLKGLGIPAVKSYGFSGDHNILVMELLGKSLEDQFQDCACKFTMKTVCMLADQMLTRMEYIHNRHIIHRDIKPDNFIMGIGENEGMVYLIDFGLAKKFRSSRNMQHIKYTNNKKLTGTARYASINALRGAEQSRRDDLEAIGYVLMYFLRGSLPWQGLKVDKREDRYKKILEKKKSTTAEELCVGFPNEFVEYINYTRNMGFEQDPDYEYLKGLFKQIMNANKWVYDNEFDWMAKGSYTSSNTNYGPKDNKNVQNTNNVNNTVTNYVNTGGNVNTSNAVIATLPDKKKNLPTQENETGLITNSNIYIQTNMNNTNQENKNNKFQVNQTNYKFIETIHNNERNNTNQAHLNTVVHLTNNDNVKNNSKLHTSMNNGKDKDLRDSQVKNTENLDESKLSKKKKDKNKNCFIL